MKALGASIGSQCRNQAKNHLALKGRNHNQSDIDLCYFRGLLAARDCPAKRSAYLGKTTSSSTVLQYKNHVTSQPPLKGKHNTELHNVLGVHPLPAPPKARNTRSTFMAKTTSSSMGSQCKDRVKNQLPSRGMHNNHLHNVLDVHRQPVQQEAGNKRSMHMVKKTFSSKQSKVKHNSRPHVPGVHHLPAKPDCQDKRSMCMGKPTLSSTGLQYMNHVKTELEQYLNHVKNQIQFKVKNSSHLHNVFGVGHLLADPDSCDNRVTLGALPMELDKRELARGRGFSAIQESSRERD